MLKIRILGSGTSSGVPRIGNDWGVCDPAEPRNRRTRASVLVESATTRILVDTSPDMRDQLNAAGADRIDAVIWTHDHADHTHGIDDLRQLFHIARAPAAGFAHPQTIRRLQARFGYVFSGGGGYRAIATLDALGTTRRIGDIGIFAVDQPHGNIFATGLRFESAGKSIGYATDFHEFTSEMRTLYTGLDIWVVDALRRAPHPTHPHLDAVLEWIAQCAPTRSALVHMDNSMDYAQLAGSLPPGVEPGYDGMELMA